MACAYIYSLNVRIQKRGIRIDWGLNQALSMPNRTLNTETNFRLAEFRRLNIYSHHWEVELKLNTLSVRASLYVITVVFWICTQCPYLLTPLIAGGSLLRYRLYRIPKPALEGSGSKSFFPLRLIQKFRFGVCTNLLYSAFWSSRVFTNLPVLVADFI